MLYLATEFIGAFKSSWLERSDH